MKFKPLIGSMFIVSLPLQAFESSKVLPRGVRHFNVRAVDTNIDQKTDAAGNPQPLAEPLAKDLTFAKIAKDEELHRANELRAFLLQNGFQESDTLGTFTAEMRGRLSVIASIFSYGVSDSWSLAIAVPYYRASTKVEMGFQPNATARAFLAALQEPETNETASAREAAEKINHAVERLNNKLRDHNYRQLQDWEDSGVGDITLAAKHRYLSHSQLASAYTAGFVLPTGRRDDPDILTDVGFGDGQTDGFLQLAVDEMLFKDVVFNQYAQYTVQFPGQKSVRAKTPEEEIDVEVKETRFKLGDKIDTGASVTYQPHFGLVTGLGYKYFRKYADVYRRLGADERAEQQANTNQMSHNAEARLGYSTVPAYLSGDFSAPFELMLSYTRQLRSQNMPIADLAQMDISLFF